MIVAHRRGELRYLSAAHLGAVNAFSTRCGGVSPPPFDTLNLGKADEDTRDNIVENYTRLCAALGAETRSLVFSKQVHGDIVRAVTREHAGEGLYGKAPMACDALITDDAGVTLTVFSADCVPLLLYDPVHHAIGAVHAGWRGTALGIARKAAAAMGERYGSRPSELRAAIGPAIGPCCFETHSDVPDALVKAWGALAFPSIEKHDGGTFHVDLKALNKTLLTDMGVPSEQIAIADDCTCCRAEHYFSHRRSGSRRGVQAALIALPKV